jgi:hypothetical protein
MLNTNLSIAPRTHTVRRQQAPAFGEGVITDATHSVVTSSKTNMPIAFLEITSQTGDGVGRGYKGRDVKYTLAGSNNEPILLCDMDNNISFSYQDESGKVSSKRDMQFLKEATDYLNKKLNP